MSRNVLVESRGLFEKFKRLEQSAQDEVRQVIRETAQRGQKLAAQLASVPVVKGRRGQRVRSRPGQAPRQDSGRLRRSIRWKTSPKGWVGYITTDNSAQDRKGNRYGWMLESGTKTVRKRPLFKRVQRLTKRQFQREIGAAMIRAVRRAQR